MAHGQPSGLLSGHAAWVVRSAGGRGYILGNALVQVYGEGVFFSEIMWKISLTGCAISTGEGIFNSLVQVPVQSCSYRQPLVAEWSCGLKSCAGMS